MVPWHVGMSSINLFHTRRLERTMHTKTNKSKVYCSWTSTQIKDSMQANHGLHDYSINCFLNTVYNLELLDFDWQNYHRYIIVLKRKECSWWRLILLPSNPICQMLCFFFSCLEISYTCKDIRIFIAMGMSMRSPPCTIYQRGSWT